MGSSQSMLSGTSDRRTIHAWCLYDWANSAFATTVMVALFPPFFRSLGIAAGLSPASATAYWGFTTAIALLIVALLAPFLGAAADRAGRRKRSLLALAAVGILGTASLALIQEEAWRVAAGLFIVANFGFAGANIFYESLLPHITSPDNVDRVSARGYAMGYVGGGILLVINLLWVLWPTRFGLPDAGMATRVAFLSVAVWWAGWSIPLVLRVAEPLPRARATPPAVTGAPGWTAASRPAVAARPGEILRDLGRHRPLLIFLIAFWIYGDGIGTMVKMATAYGDEIGIGLADMVTALVITQFVGIPCTLLFGRLAAKIGTRPAILCGLTIYALIAAGGYFMRSALHFYLLAFVVGIVQGGTQALSRSLFASMVPRHKAAQFFGLYTTSARFAGVFGPAVFGLMCQLTGSGRLGILSIILFFVVGGLVLTRVDVITGRRMAERAPL